MRILSPLVDEQGTRIRTGPFDGEAGFRVLVAVLPRLIGLGGSGDSTQQSWESQR